MTDRFASTLYGYKSWNVFIKNLNFFSTEERNHHHEQHCDCSGVIQIPGHHHLSGPKVGRSHWVHCKKGPAEAVLSSPAEEVQPATGAAETVVLCHHWLSPLHINNLFGSAQLPNLTSEDYRGLSGLLSESLVHPSPLSKNCTYPEWAKELAKSLWTAHIQHTPSLNCYCLVDGIELWAPERPDTGTVSSLRQSISWTLDNNYGTHTIYTPIYLRHILSLHFNCT